MITLCGSNLWSISHLTDLKDIYADKLCKNMNFIFDQQGNEAP